MKHESSNKLWQDALQVLPGGVNSPVRAFKSVGGSPFFVHSGKGAFLTDADGNRVIDYVLSWGPLAAGHAHPEVVEAVKSAADNGFGFGAPTELETLLVVAANLADRCTIQLSYAIGVAQPLSVYVDLHGTGKVDEAKLEAALRTVMDLSPSGIRRHLDLNKPIYARNSAYGHFGRKPGRDGSFSWERTNLVKPLKAALGLK